MEILLVDGGKTHQRAPRQGRAQGQALPNAAFFCFAAPREALLGPSGVDDSSASAGTPLGIQSWKNSLA
jgi:hypothetical protein